MCPSTESVGGSTTFAAAVLEKLLLRVEGENASGHEPFVVSHAWTDGPMMYVVYRAPPSDRTWGLARDTRESIIDPGPWPDVDEAALYYYLLDFEENQPSASVRRPGEPDTIWWFGFPREGLPQRPSEIPEAYRHTPLTGDSPPSRGGQSPAVVKDPRVYGDPS